MPAWYKWDYVCSDCDAHVEITALVDGHSIKNEMCMKCLSPLTLMSVVDVTIPNVTQKKEEEMITETPDQTITLTWLENNATGIPVETSTTYSLNDVRALVYRDKSYARTMNEYYRKESQLRTLLEEVYADSSEQDTLQSIAEIFDVPLTKEIFVTAYVQVQMTVEVDMADGDYDIESLVTNNLYVDTNGECTISGYDVERVEEN